MKCYALFINNKTKEARIIKNPDLDIHPDEIMLKVKRYNDWYRYSCSLDNILKYAKRLKWVYELVSKQNLEVA